MLPPPFAPISTLANVDSTPTRSLTSLLGAQVYREDDISHEWTLANATKLAKHAADLTAMLQDTETWSWLPANLVSEGKRAPLTRLRPIDADDTDDATGTNAGATRQ